MEIRSAWLALFDECFLGKPEGAGGTWFVEKREAILPVVESLTAAQASVRLSPSVASVAAHLRHTAYYLHLGNQEFAGMPEKADWAGSWTVQEVDETEWTRIRADAKREYEELRGRISDPNFEPAGPEHATYAWAHLAHAAFHLGAIRQLACLVDG
jgi:hypothetical protein